MKHSRLPFKLIFTAIVMAFALPSFGSTYDFSYSGRLVDKDGKPLPGPVALKISFFHAETATGSILDVTQGIDNVTLKDGVFQVVVSLEGSDFQRVFPTVSQAVYIEVTDLTNASGAPYGRQRLTILPYAGKVPVDSSQFSWSSDGRLQLAVSGGADSTAVATLSNKTIDATTNTITNISNSSISATAAIADTKLATISTAGKVSGGAITSGTIGGSTAVNTSGSVATSGKMAVGGAVGTSSLEVTGSGATTATSAVNIMNSTPSSLFYVRNDGNVGIGTTSPGYSLDVVRSNGASVRVASDTGTPQLAIESTGGGGASASMYFLGGSGGGQAYFGYRNGFNIGTTPNVGAGITSKLSMDGNGNVGIGTTSPSAKLTVNENFAAYNANTHYLQGSSTTDTFMQIGQSASRNLFLGWSYDATAANAYGQISTYGGGNNLVLQGAGGNVGIGTASPAGKFTVATTADANTLNVVNATGNVLIGTGTDVTAYGGAKLQVKSSGSAANTWYGRIIAGGDSNVFLMGQLDGVAQLAGHNAALSAWADLYFNSGGANIYALSSNSTGQFTIGTVSALGARLNMWSGSPTQTGAIFRSVGASGSTTPATNNFIDFQYQDGTVVGSITPTGGAYFAGNVGIGTTNPGTKLQIAGSKTLNIDTEASGGTAVDLSSSGSIVTTAASGFVELKGSAGIRFMDTSNNERMRMTASGDFGIGTISPGYKLTVNGEPGANGYTAFTNYSDRRLKKNIRLIPDGMLSKVLSLRPSSFNYNELSGYDEETRSRKINGFIAQELREVFPEMVHETKIKGETYFDTNLSSLQIYLVKAVQEFKIYVDGVFTSHSNRLANLEADNEAKSREISQLKASNEAMKDILCEMRPEAAFCEL